MKVLETAVGAIFAPTRFSLGRISPFDTWLQTEIHTKEIWGWGWGSNFDPQNLSGIFCMFSAWGSWKRESGATERGGGSVFFFENSRRGGGGLPRGERGGEGPGGCLQRIWGGEGKIFFFGLKCPPRNQRYTELRATISAHLLPPRT